MATHIAYYLAATGKTLYAFPVAHSLANWTTYRVELTEAASPNAGRYSGTLDDANGDEWWLFNGSSQPTDWDEAVASVVLVSKADNRKGNTTGEHTDVQTLLSRLTAARAGYIDNLNVGGNVASSAEATAIQNTTRSKAVHPSTIERPDSGSATIKLKLYLFDTNGQMENADSTPSVTIENEAGTDRSGNLGAVSSTGTGEYEATYTVADTHAVENLRLTWSYVEGGNTIKVPGAMVIVDTTAVDFTSADRTQLQAIHGKLPSKSYLRGTADADGGMDSEDQADVNAQADQALADYDPPTKAELDAAESNIRGADSDTLKTLSDALDSVGSGAVDGVSRADYEEILLAFAAGQTSVTDNGDTTKTLTYKKQDGTTARITWTYDVNGQRTATNTSP